MNSEETNAMEELEKISKILLKHVKTIVITVIVTLFIFVIGLFVVIKPKYQSTAEIIVSQKLDKNAQAAEQQQIQSTDLQLVNTYKSILDSQTIGNAVKKEVGSKLYNQSTLDVSTDANSQVIGISVTSHNPQEAARIANITADVFKRKIKNIMNVNNVSIISKATQNKNPVFPKKSLGLLLGLIVGMLLGAMFALIKEYNDKTISERDFITDDLNITDLGVVSDIDTKNISKKFKK